ncbi:hypothetical protein [Clostridium sp. BL-8]|uniref:hypothetical protein n=1 Tax=Clostridium sp. BL-8 TaxID=349938 RepID=UPI00098BE4C2|nr:hypothetical protein [Clostridium sp. BL-8]OOM67699.1 hypothetical protein CLOBL_54270 [Clostridium sp. BL-8]
MFIYINKKMEKNQTAINKKLRFGIIVSSIVMALPFIFIPASDFLSNALQRLFKLNDKIITIVTIFMTFALGTVIMPFIYVPINKDKYLKLKNKRLENYKGWKYYILYNPATSMYKMFRSPPWAKRIPKVTEYIKWNKSIEDTPPLKIQIVLLLATYIITTSGLFLVGYLTSSLYVVYTNLYVLPFGIITGLFGQFMFGIVNMIEKLILKVTKKEIRYLEILNFLLFNIIYILLVSISVFLYHKGLTML